MKQKYILVLISTIVILIVAGFGMKNALIPHGMDIVTNPELLQQISSEKSTVKGVTVHQDEQNKALMDVQPVIPPPDTSWRDRELTINGQKVFYRFGEGNPPAVALSKKEIADLRSKGYGYMTPGAEKALKELLEDPIFTDTLERCYRQIDWYGRQPKAPWAQFPHALNMEDLLIVDPETGRKEFHDSLFSVIYPIFSSSTSPIMDEQQNPLKHCLGSDLQNARLIMNYLSNISIEYMKGGE